MSLRINHNTGALNAHRNLSNNQKKTNSSLEKLSSGLAINRAGDSPAMLVASEQMRAQISSMEQAIKNSETSVSMVQTAESALSEVNNMLVSMRALSIHAANEGANDAVMLEADQLEISTMVDSIDRISSTTQFGSRKLLDGSNGVSGSALGDGLEYVGAGTNTQSSDEKGFDVTIMKEASASAIMGSAALTQEKVDAGETLSVNEGGKSASYVTKSTDNVESAIRNFANEVDKAGLNLDVTFDESGIIQLKHNEKGSGYGFEVSSTTAGVLSQEASGLTSASKGADLVGTINGEATIGKGNTMTGLKGNATTDGLMVRFNGLSSGQKVPEGASAGVVTVAQNALTFQVGANAGQTVNIALQNMSAGQLGRGVDNESNYSNLRNLDVRTAQGAQDSLALIDQAINEVTQSRAELGSFQKNTLETNITTLRATTENMVAAESTVRDTDMALELANYTRNSLMTQSGAAMLAQANQLPSKVFNLVDG